MNQKHASLAALMLAGSVGIVTDAISQTNSAGETNDAVATGQTLAPVTVRANVDPPETREDYLVTRSRIGKVNQELRDVPQSVTVITEKLMSDRDMFTLRDVLKNTAGITFLAGEGGEEDIRMRGFSLAGSGDIYVDGIRDPAFYNRDMFNFSSVELLRGSASMLFGRGSTGGVVNQVSKMPGLEDFNQLNFTYGSYGFFRGTGDFNKRVGDNTAARLNLMYNNAENDGAGNSLNSKGIAGSISWGIGTRDQITASLFALETNNGINYGVPWARPNAKSPVTDTQLLPLDPKNYYGMKSDYNYSSAVYGTLNWQHTFDHGGQLNTAIRYGTYDRDQRASAIRFGSPTYLNTFNDNTVFRRGTNNKIQTIDVGALQIDYQNSVRVLGIRNDILAGIDLGQEDFVNKNATLPPGVTLTKPNTYAGTPNDGAWINESLRQLSDGRTFKAQTVGLYAQDLIHVTNKLKLLGGIRYDYFKGDFWQAATTTAAEARRDRADGVWSGRLGLMYQPDQQWSFYGSWGTSFNTSGDAYQYDPLSVNTPPEKSQNIEIGTRWESENKRLAIRMSGFWATKSNERNRDPDSANTAYLLSGKRHAAGLETDIIGRITSKWDIYLSYAWIPIAVIDEGAPGTGQTLSGELQGQRPSLTPYSQGSIWTTYRVLPNLRFGAGLTAMSPQSPNRNPGWEAPGYGVVDLMAEYTQNQWLTWQFNVNNVGNKLYAQALYSGHYSPGPGRTYMLTARFNF